MTLKNETTQPTIRFTLIRRMLVGALIALLPISLMVFTVDNPDPAWGAYWMIRPLIIVPLAGAAGGGIWHYMDFLRKDGGMKHLLADVISVIVYFIGVWMGSVLGLAGTLWD